jgi:hypothetical protein
MSATMRVDILTAGIYERRVADPKERNSYGLGLTAQYAYNAAAAFMAELSRRDPLTGERTHSDLPADEGDGGS